LHDGHGIALVDAFAVGRVFLAAIHVRESRRENQRSRLAGHELAAHGLELLEQRGSFSFQIERAPPHARAPFLGVRGNGRGQRARRQIAPHGSRGGQQTHGLMLEQQLEHAMTCLAGAPDNDDLFERKYFIH